MTNNIADRKDVDGNPVSLYQLVLLEPDWACARIRALEAELNQCLTAHAMLNDKVCVLEDANVALEEQLLQMHEGLTLAETEINKLEARIKEIEG